MAKYPDTLPLVPVHAVLPSSRSGTYPGKIRFRVAQAKCLNCSSGWPSREMAQRGVV